MTLIEQWPSLLALVVGVLILVSHHGRLSRRFPVFGCYLFRDIGVALIVAPLLAWSFEFYQRKHETLEATQRAFNASMSDQLTTEVWEGVQRQILTKRLLRRNVDMRVQLLRDNALPAHQAVMRLELGYDLYNLQNVARRVTVEHELDYQFWIPEANLPRFDRIAVENRAGLKEYEGAEISRVCSHGVVRLPVELERKGESHARITTVRSEVVPTPGSYNLYMTDYAQGLRVLIEQALSDLSIEVKIRPEGEAQNLKKIGKATWVSDSLILPGQGVEIKFKDGRSPSPAR